METLDSSIFDLSPIPMWIEDFSEVKKQFDLWRNQGIENLHEFLNQNQNLIYYSYNLLIDLNGKLYSAKESGISLKPKKDDRYQFAGLSLEIIEPFRKLRLRFRGYLRHEKQLIFK